MLSISTKFNQSVSLVTWAYNEEELIAGFLDRAVSELDACVSEWEIVVINDGSTDKTGIILDNYSALNSQIRVIHNESNRNVGFSCSRAIEAASKEFLFWQTVDWSYDLKNLRIFLELLKYYDVVQGIRPTPIRLLSYIPVIRSIYRVKTRSDNFQKAIVSLGNYYLLRILFGAKFHDFQNVTFYRTALIQSFNLKADSSFINPECLLRAYEKGMRFIEVPIPFIPRTIGLAKGTKLKSILRSIRDILSAWVKWGINHRRRSDRIHSGMRLHRVSEPFYLDEEVGHLIVPLLKEFR